MPDPSAPALLSAADVPYGPPRSLEDVVAILDSDTYCGGGDPPLIGLIRGSSYPESAFQFADALLGLKAPPDALAVVFASTGTAFTPADSPPWRGGGGGDDGEPDPALDGITPGARVRLVVALDRTGALVSRVTYDGVTSASPPAAGRIHDALHRSLGLPTAPPPAGTGRLLASMWLNAIVGAPRPAHGRLLGLDRVLRCHPGARTLLTHVPDASDEFVEAAIRMAPRAWTWKVLRGHAEDGCGPTPEIDPGLAAWMDDGMFARWVLDGEAPVQDLLDLALPRCKPDAAERVRADVAALID